VDVKQIVEKWGGAQIAPLGNLKLWHEVSASTPSFNARRAQAVNDEGSNSCQFTK
jgi:hypothetical protein